MGQCLNLGRETACPDCGKLAIHTAGYRLSGLRENSYSHCEKPVSTSRDTGYPQCGKPAIRTAGKRLFTLRETGINIAGYRLSIVRETGYRGRGKPAILTEDFLGLPHSVQADDGELTILPLDHTLWASDNLINYITYIEDNVSACFYVFPYGSTYFGQICHDG
jgi:hypothetical protein